MTSHLKALFQPIELTSRVKLSHRIVMAPLTRCRATEPNFTFHNNATATYYAQRATPGGLIITEATLVAEEGRGIPNTPGIYSDEHIQMWAQVVNHVRNTHGPDAYLFLQLWHKGRQASPFIIPPHKHVLSPSAIAHPAIQHTTPDGQQVPSPAPKAMTEEEVVNALHQFYTGALNARKAGLHGVEIHGAHGYLIHQFLDVVNNQRTDQWGGSVRNRCRFAFEAVKKAAAGWLGLPFEATDEDLAKAALEHDGQEKRVEVAIRLSPRTSFGGMVEDYEDAEDPFACLIKMLDEELPFKMAYLHIGEPRLDIAAEDRPQIPALNSEKYRKLYRGPWLSTNGYSYNPEEGAKEVEKGTTDMIAFGRLFITNPDLVERLKNGWELAKWDRKKFYSASHVEGYTDYPTYQEQMEEKVQLQEQ